MNKTELLAKDWLIKKGYKAKDIIKTSLSPDFTCTDGKRFEIKKLYGNKLIFYSNQIKYLKDMDVILVFNDKGYVFDFLWKEKDTICFNLKIVDTEILDGYKRVQINIPEKLNKKVSIESINYGFNDKRKTIIKILETHFKNHNPH